MENEQLYQELKNLAERLDVVVAEHSFRGNTIKTKSGYCRVKGKNHCIIDKRLRLRRKLAVLAECLGRIPHEHVFMIPAVRDIVDQYAEKTGKGRAGGASG